jgi:hypothetical protein
MKPPPVPASEFDRTVRPTDEPSADIAVLARTNGRRFVIHVKKAAFWRDASSK